MPGIDRVHKLSGVADAQHAYNDWAETYDAEMLGTDQDYVAPIIVTDYLVRHLTHDKMSESEILDAGCGTGLVGARLAQEGAKNIDGIDLSPGMLDVARRTKAYRSLSEADMSGQLALPTQSYDAVVCVGTMTGGHVGPEAFDELVRVARPGAIIISTVRGTYWESNGYKAKVDALGDAGKTKLVSAQLEDYRRGAGVQAVVAVLQVL